MLLKSYSGDLEYAQRCVASFTRFNADAIELYVVVPEADVAAFTPLAGPQVTVMSEAAFVPYFTAEPVQGIRPGYINQEIVKLAFWELELAENYFCVDSDAEFIRPFRRSDFMADDHTPFTVLVEDHELKVEPRYYREHWQPREHAIRRIQELVGLDDPAMRTCHGHQVFSGAVLRSFKEEFLAPRGWAYVDALEASPYEFSWYNMWLQKARTIEIHPREPFVKVFHHEGHHLEYILRGVTTDDIARGYLAVVINSNYSRGMGVIDAHASKAESVSRYLSYGEVWQVIRSKVRDTVRRRIGGAS
jgi:hypothetical protein